jgi:hypothetical protein
MAFTGQCADHGNRNWTKRDARKPRHDDVEYLLWKSSRMQDNIDGRISCDYDKILSSSVPNLNTSYSTQMFLMLILSSSNG